MPGSSNCPCMACPVHTHTPHPETIISTPMRLQKNAYISGKKETRKHHCVWQIKVKVLWRTFSCLYACKPWKWAESQNTMYKCHPLHNLSLKRPRRSHHLLSKRFPWNTSIQPVNSLYNWDYIIWSLGSTRFLHQACCLYGAVVKGNHLTDMKSFSETKEKVEKPKAH